MDTTAVEPFACLEGLPTRAAADHEWTTAARYWTGTITVAVGAEVATLTVADGTVTTATWVPVGEVAGGEAPAPPEGPTDVVFHVPPAAWPSMLEAVPRPFFQDWMAARRHGLRVGGSVEAFYQYYPALRRLLELLRDAENGAGR